MGALLAIGLAAVVTGVSVDGVYLDEGARQGVRAGDRVTIGPTTLTIVAVGPSTSRTDAPPDPFALRVGATADIARSGQPAEEASKVGPRKPHAPDLDPVRAVDLWSVAPPAWTEPRPLPAGARAAAQPPSVRWRSVAGLYADTVWVDGANDLRLTPYHRLDLDGGQDGERWWYRYDLRGSHDTWGQRHPRPAFDVRRLEGAYVREGWHLRGGRVTLGDPLAAATLDGAQVGLGQVRLFAGLAPEPLDRRPRLEQPQGGVAATHTVALGDDLELVADGTLFASAFEGALDRAALAPVVTLRSRTLLVVARAELDAWLDGTPEGRSGVDPTRLFALARVDLTDWLDTSVRYERYAAPPLPSLLDAGAPFTDVTRHTAWADARLRAGTLGDLTLSGAVFAGDEGESWSPGVDYRVAALEWLDTAIGWLGRRGDDHSVDDVHLGLTARADAPWPLAFDLGGRTTWLAYADRSDLDETTLSVEAGAWVTTPAGFDLRLAAEHTDARVPVTRVFTDLRWRLGR